MMLTLHEIHDALTHLTLDQRLAVESWLQELNVNAAPSQVQEARTLYHSSDASFMTLEEFLEFEKKNPLRHEFINGAVFTMAAPSASHSRITSNLMLAIAAYLKRSRCEVFSSGLKVLIRQDLNEIAYCPDVMVDCRPETRAPHYSREPKLVVEVMSPATRLTDSREKLLNYPLIDSLEEYVLIAEDEWRVVIYPRAESWRPRVYDTLDAAVELRSIELTLPMIELYEGVRLP